MIKKIIYLFIAFHFQLFCLQASKFDSYKGLVMAGYQGWFNTPTDGVNRGWFHYQKNRSFEPGSCTIDMWPDMREYAKQYPTDFRFADGSTAYVFSSYDESTIDLHFKWMKEYGVDGAFMQRFFNVTRQRDRNHPSTVVLQHAIEAASTYERAFAVMYDLSGLKASGEDCSSVIEDWKYLVDSLKVTNQKGSKTYLFHQGKPLVAIWGLGFPDRPYIIRNIGIERLIDFLKNDPVYGGCSVMLGVPTCWRDLNADCLNDPYLHTLIKKADIVLPWTVQRFSPLLHNDTDRYRDIMIADMEWCTQYGVDYAPCVYPGFSWHNLSRFEFPDDVKPTGSIPRQGGHFYWQLISTAILAGAEMLYVAMFDEVNEGTAIFKCTDNPPVSSIARFIGIDGVPSDHYLWLTGEAAKMLRKEKPLSIKLPLRID